MRSAAAGLDSAVSIPTDPVTVRSSRQHWWQQQPENVLEPAIIAEENVWADYEGQPTSLKKGGSWEIVWRFGIYRVEQDKD